MTTTTSADDERPITQTAPPVDELAGELSSPPRRPMAAGRVLIVALIALFVGSLLNAPGIRKTALGQPVGWRRDISTAFANPLYDVSHALYLDRARVEFKDLLGRSSDDAVNTRLPSPTAVPPGPTPTTLPPRQAFTPTHQLRLWVGGDSLADTPGQSLIDQAAATGAVGILGPVDSHVATGLSRPEVFNWPAYLKQVLPPLQPDAVVLTFGANDDQTLTGDGGGERFGGPDWQAEYARRVGGLMDSVVGLPSHPRLFIVGIPPIKDIGRYNADYVLINNIYRTQAAARAGHVFYVDAASVLAGPGGAYTDTLTNLDGTVVIVRAADGIHFTRAGGDRVAAKTLQVMGQAFDLTSWRTATTTPTTVPKGSQHRSPSSSTSTNAGPVTTTTTSPTTTTSAP
jgi:hypothetical protein